MDLSVILIGDINIIENIEGVIDYFIEVGYVDFNSMDCLIYWSYCYGYLLFDCVFVKVDRDEF